MTERGVMRQSVKRDKGWGEVRESNSTVLLISYLSTFLTVNILKWIQKTGLCLSGYTTQFNVIPTHK